MSYRHGFQFTSPSHNLFSINEPPHRLKETDLGAYDHEYDSTVAYGKTIFWKLTKIF